MIDPNKDPEMQRSLAFHQAQVAGFERSIARAEYDKLHPVNHRTADEMDALIIGWRIQIERQQALVENCLRNLEGN